MRNRVKKFWSFLDTLYITHPILDGVLSVIFVVTCLLGLTFVMVVGITVATYLGRIVRAEPWTLVLLPIAPITWFVTALVRAYREWDERNEPAP